MTKKRKLKKKVRKFTSIFAVCLACFLSLSALAKYTDLTSGSGTKDVAKWDVSYSSSDNDSKELNLVSGNVDKNYIVKVTSKSEVSTTYSIILDNVPSEMQVKVDDKSFKTPTNNKIIFEDIGSFSANDANKTNTHTLVFSAPLDSNISSSNEIDIDIKFIQTN